MADDYVQVPSDDTGKKLQTHKNTVGANDVHAEAVVIVDDAGVSVDPAKEAGGNLATIAGDTTSLDGKVTACNTGAVIVSGALPAGANNIGDVDVLSVVPGTTATSLGKAEDGAHTSGDVGVQILGVRKDSLTTLTNVDGDYIPFVADEYGRQKIRTVHEQTTYKHAFFNAAADGAIVALVVGKVIKVHSLALQGSGTVTVNIRTDDAAGTILDTYTLQAREGMSGLPFAPYPAHWMQSDAGEALYCDVTAAVNVKINVIYTDADAS